MDRVDGAPAYLGLTRLKPARALLKKYDEAEFSAVFAWCRVLAGVEVVSSIQAPASGTSASAAPLVDRIRVDAPCANTGMMRRRVDLRWRVSVEEIDRLRVSQGQLLGQAAALLRPGGTLVYSTCSLEAEENETVVRDFLASHAGFRLESERQLLPFTDGVDGAYVARLVRKAGMIAA